MKYECKTCGWKGDKYGTIWHHLKYKHYQVMWEGVTFIDHSKKESDEKQVDLIEVIDFIEKIGTKAAMEIAEKLTQKYF